MRFDYQAASPEAIKAMLSLEKTVQQNNLEKSLLELVKIRVSQINGCAYCLDKHCHDAKQEGESERRLYNLALWPDSTLFTPRERAALAWAEAVTLVAAEHVPQEVYEAAIQQFSEKELVDLTLAVITINGWNRLAISFEKMPS
jgi:AhpD family alkylhydroperoxidase